MKIAIVYWSGTGNTKAMAEALEGALRAGGAEADLMTPDAFTADAAAAYDAVALGCPSMGSEVLEESEFEPMFDAVEPALGGKHVALFGSYGWGDGEWMRDWEARASSAGLNVVGTVICQEAPDDQALKQLAELGAKLLGAPS